MDIVEVEESLFAASDAKLHAEMCKTLSLKYCKILSIFPELEAARPRSKSGIQALCSLHVALEKAKNVLQHCSDCSKLYLAITGDSVLLKFEKARSALVDSLKRVEDIVPQSIGSQMHEVVNDLESAVFSLDPSEKQIGEDIIALLQQGRKFNDCNDNNELECFHQAATKLGITSSRTALTERRALKKLIERARAEEDKRKESIVAYLLHLMRKYSKLFRNEFSDDNDSQGSTPCSPTVQGAFEENGGNHAFDRQLSKLGSFNFKPSISRRSGPIPLVPPEELRCPISLQLMYDPVIISSGQTYERVCIEKWFNDGHNTCPKTQQKLAHLCLTPNYCVKGLIASWCDQHGVLVPDGPPESLDLNYWRLALSDSETTNSRSINNVGSGKVKSVKVVPLEEKGTIEEEINEIEDENEEDQYEEVEDGEGGINAMESHEDLLAALNGEEDMVKKCNAAEQVRRLLKDDEEARIFMGANGFVEALLKFLESAVHYQNLMAQEVGAMALFNLAVNNNRNKELMIAAQVMPLLEEMISNRGSRSQWPATAMYLNLSCLEEAKHIIGSSRAVPFLVGLLMDETDPQCRLDALHTLYNLSSHRDNIPALLQSGMIPALQSLLATCEDHNWAEKSIAVLINLCSNQLAKDEMASSLELIATLATILDTGSPAEQEQAVTCLLVLCSGNDKCIQMVLQEGVIPALVSVSVNGTNRGREKAQKLLMLFREQRQRDHTSPKPSPPLSPRSLHQEQPPPMPQEVNYNKAMVASDGKPFCKSSSRRKVIKGWGFLWKTKSYSMYQC